MADRLECLGCRLTPCACYSAAAHREHRDARIADAVERIAAAVEAFVAANVPQVSDDGGSPASTNHNDTKDE